MRRWIAIGGIGFAALGGAVVLWSVLPSSRGVPTASPVGPGGETTAESEPNNAVATAQPLTPPSQVAGRIEPGDPDVFRVVVDQPGGFRFHAWSEGPEEVLLSVSGQDGRILASVSAPGRIRALGIARGTYYVALAGPPALRPGADAKYRLFVQSMPAGSEVEWEPNETPKQAEVLTEPEPPRGPGGATAADRLAADYQIRGWWERPGDVDCYFVPLTVPKTGGVLRFELTPPQGVRPELWVLDSGDERILVPRRELTRVAARGPGLAAVIPGLGARSWEPSYGVCCQAAAGRNFADSYRLQVRAYRPAEPLEFEPNDSADIASALPRAIVMAGFLPGHDVDWYRIGHGAPELEAYAVPRETALELTLLDDRQQPIASRTGTRDEALRLSATGAAYARIRSLTDEAGPAAGYTVRIDPPGASIR
jgi:hypothetical protein